MSEQTLFTRALELSPAQRGPFLDEACRADPDLRRRLEHLLRLHSQAGDFLESGPDDTVMPSPPSIVEAPGSEVGPYKLLEQIGEGGMGIVYLAEQQQPVQRRVALKVIKPGMDTREVLSRFEAERHALSLMDHPNIARVVDAGTTASG